MKIGLYFGSFNPIHHGHLIIANYVQQYTELDQVWLVVSPQNPLKPQSSLLNEYDRLHLVNIAIENEPNLKSSDIEFKLPRPSYTIDTLTYLSEKYTQHEFFVIMGSDSYQNITKWKNYQQLLDNYKIFVYNRPGFEISDTKHSNIQIVKAPLLEISSTVIRQMIQNKKSISFMVPYNVKEEIEKGNYYQKK